MYLHKVRLNQFRSLQNFDAADLSEGLTVFHSASSEESSEWVEFLRQLFFGFDPSEVRSGRTKSVPGPNGEAILRHTGGEFAIRRSIAAEGRESLAVTDAQGRSVSLPGGLPMARWVTRDVFREICVSSPGEVDQFDLLHAVCREADTRHTAETELRQALAAIDQVRRDRDGNGLSGGLVHQISRIRSQQGDIQGRIAVLRKPPVDHSARISQMQQEKSSLEELLAATESRMSLLESSIEDLERQIATAIPPEVPSEAGQQTDLSGVAESLEQWRAIRSLIRREATAGGVENSLRMQSDDTMLAMRHSMARLEEQVCSVAGDSGDPNPESMDSGHADESVQQIRMELTTLTERLAEYEEMLRRRQTSRATFLMKRCLQDATELVGLLEEQLIQAAPANDVCQGEASDNSVDRSRVSGSGSSATECVAEKLEQLKVELQASIACRDQTRQQVEERDASIIRLKSENPVVLTLEQLDQLRATYAELETQITILEEERRQLDSTEDTLKELIIRLQNRTVSGLFETASEYLRRISCGDCQTIAEDPSGVLSVRLRFHTELVPIQTLDLALRQLCGLALRLALIREQAAKSESVPLVLNQCLPVNHETRLAAIAKLLMEITGDGHQIIVLTSSASLTDIPCLKTADLRAFNPPAQLTVDAALPVSNVVSVAAPAPALQIHAWVEPTAALHETVELPAAENSSTESVSTATAGSQVHATNWLFYLEADYGVEELAGISLGELEALRTSGILKIEDVLTRTVPQLEELTRQRGFLVAVERLQALRGQAELTSRVPMLRRGDAALLFASGIHTADELGRLRPETVYERVTEFQRSDAGLRYRRAGRLIDRQQALNWARFGQFARSLDEVRESRSRFGVRSGPATMARLRVASESPATGAASGLAEPTVDAAVGITKKRRRKSPGDSVVQERRARRSARREQLSNQLRVDAEESDVRDAGTVERVGGMRFFLGRTSDVKSAPSIGPRTAELFHAAGIRTIEEFLSISAERLAEKLNSRRITPALIRQWQTQAQLMCQIPELRGNDSQILVACGVSTPEALANKAPEDLLAKVLPFVDSGEGKRILRNGRRPDLAAVTDWIQWAANARPFRAA